MADQNGFSLKCSDEGFLKRQENAFCQLFEIEKQRMANRVEPMQVEKQHIRKNIKVMKAQQAFTNLYRQEKSIFKVPKDSAPRHFLKRMPDFKKNPHKWTRYSLEDVKDEDMSERGNTKAALSFLKELSDRNDKVLMDNSDHIQDPPQKIVFKRPVLSTASTEVSSEENLSFRGSKIVMPEYVIGQKVKKNKKNRIIKNKNDQQTVKLNHLFAEDLAE